MDIQPRKRSTPLVLLLLCVLLLNQPIVSRAHPLAQGAQPAIRLAIGSFIPSETPLPLDPELTISGYPPGQAGYYLVQFQGPVKQPWKDLVTATGASLLGYIPDFAFKVRMTPEQATQVAQLTPVQWVGIFQPAYKLNLNLAPSDPTTSNLYKVRIETGADLNRVIPAITTTGAQIVRQDQQLLLVTTTGSQLNALARVLDVAWIDAFAPFEKFNEFGAGVIVGANSANYVGYNGSSQLVAVADTGLGNGTPTGAHPDIPTDRIKAIVNLPGKPDALCFKTIVDDGARDVDSGHGTHVTTSLLGDGGATGEGKGAAPAARLIFQAVENFATLAPLCMAIYQTGAGYFLTGLPDNLQDLYQQAYDQGARIHANSWGASSAGRYTADSVQTDSFIWQHPDMAITFAAGNAGVDLNRDGAVDRDSIGAPATAKNVLAVGASENQRSDGWPCDGTLSYPSDEPYQTGQSCSGMGGKNLLGAWDVWGFGAEPLKSDLTAGNQEQMAAFSSRGPTDDGRIKPDVVAPGSWILSGYSELFQEGYDGDPLNSQNNAFQDDGWGLPLNKFYKYMSGTSMANPIAAGAAAVVRDFYQKARNHAASAALIKATLINSAADLLDENNDGANDNDFPIPNIHEGWGRVNLANATNGSRKFVENVAGLTTNGSIVYDYPVGNADQPFKVSLAWSDAPGSESAAVALVNDLDLLVTSPSGVTFRGNRFSGGWSQTGETADRLNNVENVYIQHPETGAWKVEVVGLNIPQGPQPFALVVDGTTADIPAPTLSAIQPQNGAQGMLLNVAITGMNTHFVGGKTTTDFGAGIQIKSLKVDSATQATVEIAIANDASPGPRTVTITTGSETVNKPNGFTVTAPTQTGALLLVEPTTTTLHVGEIQTLSLVVAPGQIPVNGVQINGKVDPSYLRLVQVTAAAAPLSQVLDPLNFRPESGEFRYGAGLLGGTISNTFTVLTLEVQALKPTGADGTAIQFLQSYPPTDISNPTGSVLQGVQNGKVIISQQDRATLQGTIDLQGRPSKPHAAWSIPLTVELMPVDGSTPISHTVQSNERGEFTLSDLPIGVYHIRVKSGHTLRNLVKNVELKGGVNTVYLATLLEGDVDLKTSFNQALLADFGPLSGSFNRCATESSYVSNADLDEADDCVTIKDFGLLSENYLKQGDIVYASPGGIPLPLPLPLPLAVLTFGAPRIVAPVGELVAFPLYVDPNHGDGVRGVTVHLRFDPTVAEVVDVNLLTNELPTILEAPRVDNQQGAIAFSMGVLGKTIDERFQIATLQVRLKTSAIGTTIMPADTFPPTDISGSNGSVMAHVEAVTISDLDQPHQLFLPLLARL